MVANATGWGRSRAKGQTFPVRSGSWWQGIGVSASHSQQPPSSLKACLTGFIDSSRVWLL